MAFASSTDAEWMDLAERCSLEDDPVELMKIIPQLIAALDRRHDPHRGELTPSLAPTKVPVTSEESPL